LHLRMQEVLVDGGQLAGELFVEQLQDFSVPEHVRPLPFLVSGAYTVQSSEPSLAEWRRPRCLSSLPPTTGCPISTTGGPRSPPACPGCPASGRTTSWSTVRSRTPAASS